MADSPTTSGSSPGSILILPGSSVRTLVWWKWRRSPRVNGEGNSIRFGGLAQRVAVNNCDIDSLILEFDEDWSTFLGPPGPFQPSPWNGTGVKARTISFNAVGPVQTIDAANLDAGASFTVSNAAGQISGSRLTLAPNDVQLANLRQLLFQNCVFTLPQK